MAHLVKRRKEWKKKELREHKANFFPLELNLEIIQKCHTSGLFLFPKIIHACAYLPTSPLQSHPTWLGDGGDRNQVVQMSPCWLIYRFLCVTLVSLSAFWHLHCLVVYLYCFSSFIKNSVSGAGRRALGSGVDRLFGNHPPLVPSRAPPALAASRSAPKACRGRKTKRRWTEATSERLVFSGK